MRGVFSRAYGARGIDAPALGASSLPRYKVTVGAGAPSVEPASALHGLQATAIDGRTDLTEVRRVDACGRQCPCAHVRVSEREVARFVTLNDVGEDATETDGARAS